MLTKAIYGHQPRTWLVTVPAVDFSLGGALSATACCGAEEALERIAAVINSDGIQQAEIPEHAKRLGK
jgi:hypothetical protein